MPKRVRVRAGKPEFAVAYVRVSTDEQANGIEAQQAAIATWAAANKVQIVAFVEDRGVSGATPVEDRPGLMQALFHIRAYRAGRLVVAKRDRLARDVVVAATIERLAMDAGATVHSADGVSAEDTPEGKLMRGLLDLFAQYERAVIRARTKAALEAKLRRGEYTGGRSAPYGFTLDADRNLVPIPAEQKTIARARDLRTLSLRKIAATLVAEGLTQEPLHPQTIARILARN